MCVGPDVTRGVSQGASQSRRCCPYPGSHSGGACRGTSGGIHPSRSRLESTEEDEFVEVNKTESNFPECSLKFKYS